MNNRPSPTTFVILLVLVTLLVMTNSPFCLFVAYVCAVAYLLWAMWGLIMQFLQGDDR